MSSLDRLRKKKGSLKEIAQNMNGKKFQKDERFWELSVDKVQKGEAIIRFLPGTDGEENAPIVPFKQYFIRTPKGMFVADAPENAGLKSFPADTASKIWALHQKTGNDDYKKLFINRVAKTNYIANIYVVRDPANEENEGKVFLFKFGRQIKKMIESQMGLDEKDDDSILIEENREPYDPIDLWDGANFYLKAYSDTGKALNRKYDKSKFLEQSPLSEDEEEMLKIYNQVYSLKEFSDPSRYKESYEEMAKRYKEMTGDYELLFPDECDSKLEGTSKKEQKEYAPLNSNKSEDVIDDEDDELTISQVDDDDDEDLDDEYERLLNGG